MMSKTCALVFLSALGGGDAGACTPATSCPKLSDGLYCPVNDVTEHGDINEDVKHIATFLRETPPNYAEAKKIYTEGKESSKGGGIMRTLQGLAQKDMTVKGKYTNTFYSGAFDLYGSTDAIWHDLMMACLDDTGFCKDKSDDYRTYVINKGAIGIVTAYVTYETGAAIWKAADGSLADDGAAYAWDEAAAFYIGNVVPSSGDGVTGKAPGNLYSPYEFNWKRDTDFPDGVQTHAASIPILNHGLKATRQATYSDAKIKEAEMAMYRIFAIAAFRSAIKYSWKAYGDGTLSYKYLAEGFIYWRSASGYLSTLNKTAVQEIDALLDFTKTSMEADVPCQVKTKVESLYQPLGITCDMMGPWKDAPAGSCMAGTCSTKGGSLLAGDTGYLDYCKPAPTTTASTEASGAAAAGALLAGLVALVHMA